MDSSYSWRVAAVTLLMASLGFGAITAVPVLLKPIAAEWGRSAAEVAAVHSAALLGAGASSLWIGRLHDRFGFFPLAVTSAIATGAGLVLASTANGLLQFSLAFGLLVGAGGQGVLFSPLIAAVSQWFQRYRALAISIAACGQGLGGLAIPPLLRACADSFGWRPTLMGLGLLCGAILFACSFVFRRTPPSEAVTPGSAVSRTAEAPFRLLSLGLCLALFNLGTFAVIGHLTAAAEEAGATPVAAASLVSVLLGFSLVSRLITPLLARRSTTSRNLWIASVLIVLGLIALWGSLGSYWGTCASSALIGLGFGVYIPAYAVLARESCNSTQAGRRISEMYFFGFAAGAAGTWGGGFLRDVSGSYSLSFFSAGAAGLMGLIVLRVQLRRSPTHKAGTERSRTLEEIADRDASRDV